jgi:N-acetylglucosaminyl-diphospho-decaprenol L-rhamnosyltransferase
VSLTVVTVLHDSAAELEVLLDSLERHGPPGRQVVAVDTGSADGGAVLARARGAEVLELGGNPGLGAANNAGLARARHAVTALVNPDCELLDGGLTGLAGAAGLRCALFAPRLVGGDGMQQRTAHALPGTPGALVPALVHPPALPRAVRERADPWRASRARTVGWAIAACLVARTAILRRLGPFDPAQFLFFEDLDLCLRARAAGVPTVFVPEVTLRHAGGHSTRRAYGGEPHALLARRRREVVAANLGPRAAALDGAAQALTFATRWAARAVLGRERDLERDQLRAQLAVRPRRCT